MLISDDDAIEGMNVGRTLDDAASNGSGFIFWVGF